jgi:hypothetical protein
MDKKEYQNNWKKEQRIDNSEYAQRVRLSKNSEETKERRKELRKRPESLEKEMLYQREYRKRPEVKAKNKARQAVNSALINGILKRSECCDICKIKDITLKDGRTGLRADHYLGYEKENYLNVKFICVKCDGKQLRKYN